MLKRSRRRKKELPSLRPLYIAVGVSVTCGEGSAEVVATKAATNVVKAELVNCIVLKSLC